MYLILSNKSFRLILIDVLAVFDLLNLVYFISILQIICFIMYWIGVHFKIRNVANTLPLDHQLPQYGINKV